MKNFLVTPNPFIKSKVTVTSLLEHKAIMLTMVFLVGVICVSLKALLVLAVSVASALLFELLYNLICYEKFKIDDCSFLITALSYSCLASANVPLYIPVVAMFFAVIVMKMAFGGYSNNMFNLAGAGALFVGAIFGSASFYVAEEGLAFNADVYGNIARQNFDGFNILDFVLGKVNAPIGSACVIAVAVALVFLIVFKVIEWKIPLVSIISYCFMALCLNGFNFACVLPYICCGNFLFVATFLLTDYFVSPHNTLGQIIYALIFGVLCAVVTRFNLGADLGILAVLILCNCFAPLFDRVIRPFYFGEVKTNE